MTVAMEGCLGPIPETPGFTPRATRISLRIPVIFDFARGRARGQSVNVSESGVLAAFDRHLDIWITGRLSILVGESDVSIEARVARVNGREAALAFRGMSDKNRAAIQKLIKDTPEGSV
jgi:hypothetical protein